MLDQIYEKGKNYIYNIGQEEEYLLFNPLIHKWMTIDGIGKEIVELMEQHHSLQKVKRAITQKYGIEESVFEEDVMPFVSQLVKQGYYGEETVQETAAWMNGESIQVSKDNYPYNSIVVSLTNHCNLNCTYCFNKTSRIENSKNVPFDEHKIVEMLKRFKEARGEGVVFTGGEPTLNPSLGSLCRAAKELGLKVRLITNGMTLNGYPDLEGLCKSLDDLVISCDSVVEEELETLWKVPMKDKLENMFAGFARLSEIARDTQLHIIISPIVSKVNGESLLHLVPKMKEIFQGCDVRFELTKYMPIGIPEDEDLEVSEETYVQHYIHAFDKVEYQKQWLEFHARSHTGKYAPHPIPNLYVCKPSFFINADGEVYPCQSLVDESYYLGNIQEDDFDAINERFIDTVGRNCLVRHSKCTACELRFACGNKGGICGKKDSDACKEETVYEMYLQTKI